MNTKSSIWPQSVRRIYWNESEHRPRAIWRLVIFIFVVAVVANPLILALDATDHPLLKKSLEVPLAAVGFIVALWVLCRFIEKRPMRDYGVSRLRENKMEWAVGFAIGGSVFSVLALALWSSGSIALSYQPYSQIPAFPFALVIGGQILRYTAGGIFEEIVSRGVLLRTAAETLSSKFGRRPALLAAWLSTSMLFGVLHMFNPNATLLGAVNLSLLGLAFGVPMLLSGRLGMSVGIHMAWNIFQNNIFGFANGGKLPVASILSVELSGSELITGGAFGPEGSLLLPLAAILISVAAILWTRYSSGGIRLQLSLADPPGRIRQNA